MYKFSISLSNVVICVLISHFALAGGTAPPTGEERYRISQEEREAIEKVGYIGIAAKAHKNGIIVNYLDPDGPAVKAGLKVNDIMTAIDDQKIYNRSAFNEFMNRTRAGQKLTVTFLRKGKEDKLVVTLAPVSPKTIRYKLKMKLGQSWRTMASDPLERKDFDNAIKYYETWLNADPEDKTSWYNLACAHALKGDKEKALQTWEYAVDAGWEDTKYPPKDESLELIWSEERFKRGLERCANNKDVNKPKGYKRNYVEMQSLGTYIVMLPPDYEESNREYPLCIILHGGGSTETDHGNMADRMGRDGIIYIAPRASYPHTGQFMEARLEGWTAWPPYDFGEDKSFFRCIDSLNVEWIFGCAADAKERYRVSGDKVFLVGHCQGAFLGSACAAFHPELVKSYFAYAGAVPDFCIDPEALKRIKKHNVKPYFAHCSEDELVDPEESKKAEKAMTAAGVDCVLRIYDANHYISGDVYSFMREWLDTEVRIKDDGE